MKLSKRAATQTVLQNVEQVKTRITSAINGLNATMQQVQNGVKQMQDLMKDVQTLDTQVRSLQQYQAKQQAALQQSQQQSAMADDAAFDKPAWWQKLWGQLQGKLGPQWKEEDAYNAVAGVRGSNESDDLFTRTAKGKKPKSKHSLEPMPKHPTPRDTEHNKNLPPFWRRNFDYGESPYMHMDELDEITDEVPHGKRKKRKKD